MWAVQMLKRGICKTPCKPMRNLAKIKMSPKHVLPPLWICLSEIKRDEGHVKDNRSNTHQIDPKLRSRSLKECRCLLQPVLATLQSHEQGKHNPFICNSRCCYFQTPSVVYCMNATASAQSPTFLRNFYPQIIQVCQLLRVTRKRSCTSAGNAQAQLHFRDDQQRAFGISNISN